MGSRPALEALGRPAARCAYIGDTVTFDVVGALNAGLVPIHLDPYRACTAADPAHAPEASTRRSTSPS